MMTRLLNLSFILIILFAACGKEDHKAITPLKNREILDNNKKVTFIELGSVRCIPCKMMQPILEEVEADYGDQVDVVFHDVWTEAGKPYAAQYQIQAIPTQVFLDADGNEYFRHTGFFPKEELLKVLKQKGVK